MVRQVPEAGICGRMRLNGKFADASPLHLFADTLFFHFYFCEYGQSGYFWKHKCLSRTYRFKQYFFKNLLTNNLTFIHLLTQNKSFMQALQKSLSRFLSVAAATVFFTGVSLAQTPADQAPAQGAQTGETQVVWPTETAAPVANDKATVAPQATKKIPQIVTPANATAKQAKKIAKLNESLAKAAEQQGEVKELSKAQKAAAQKTLAKLAKKLDKMGVEETKEIKAIKEAAAAKALNSMTLVGIILMGAGLLFVLLFGGVIGVLGLLMLIAGLVLLIIGVTQS